MTFNRRLQEKIKGYDTNKKQIVHDEESNNYICPHCGQIIKRRELKIGKDKKSIIHGKCEGKISIPNEMQIDEIRNLFENHTAFIKEKMQDLISKAIKDLDISKIGDVGQEEQPDKHIETDPLEDAKKDKNKKIFKPPKQNQ